MKTIVGSQRVKAALEALDLHTKRESDLQRRYADSVAAADALASELGAAVLEDPGREAKASAELAKVRASVELLGRGVERAEQDRLKLQAAVALARAADCRERAGELRKRHDEITREVSRHFDEVERLEGVRPGDVGSGGNSEKLWREFASLEASAAGLETDPASGYVSIVETLKQEAAAA